MTEYLLLLEQGPTSWRDYCPNTPGCVAVAETRNEAQKSYGEALKSWTEATMEDGDPIPLPAAETDTVTVALAGQTPHRYLTIFQPVPLGGWSVSPADVPDLVLQFSTRARACICSRRHCKAT